MLEKQILHSIQVLGVLLVGFKYVSNLRIPLIWQLIKLKIFVKIPNDLDFKFVVAPGCHVLSAVWKAQQGEFKDNLGKFGMKDSEVDSGLSQSFKENKHFRNYLTLGLCLTVFLIGLYPHCYEIQGLLAMGRYFLIWAFPFFLIWAFPFFLIWVFPFFHLKPIISQFRHLFGEVEDETEHF